MSLIMTTYPFDSDDIYFLLGLISFDNSPVRFSFDNTEYSHKLFLIYFDNIGLFIRLVLYWGFKGLDLTPL